jgi:excinuclease ABC subunit B
LEDKAWRISIFKDKIDSIVEFDPLTGNKLKDLEFVKIYANSHYITPKPTLEQAIKEIKKELKLTLEKHKSENKHLEAQRLDERTRFDLEMLEATGTCAGIENYSRYIDKRSPGTRPFCLLDYFPDDYLMIVDESHVTLSQVRAMYGGDRSRKENLVEYGFRLPAAMDNRPLKYDEFEFVQNQVIYVSATPSDYELEKTEGIFTEQIIRPTGVLDPVIEVRESKNQIDDLINEIQIRVEKDERILVTTLTKRMAEELTKYLNNIDVRSRYIHSDIDTLERVEIMQGLRKGLFDVLVGVNLLREGLDLPEVSLVAIIDADKEGFLRSHRSLTQTIGRAARNINGKAIFYGDKVTKSMQKTIDETNYRRKKQNEFNIKNNITPTPLKTKIKDVFGNDSEKNSLDKIKNSNQLLKDKSKMSNGEKTKQLNSLRKDMEIAAKALNFIEAARIRDIIKEFKK